MVTLHAPVRLLWLVFSIAGCATSATALTPDEIPKDEAAFFGRIRIGNEGKDITPSCKVAWSDGGQARKANMQLDATGWVFGTVVPGRTSLKSVLCKLGAVFPKTCRQRVREVNFEVPGQGMLAYFGDVQIELKNECSSNAANALMPVLGPLVTALYTERQEMTIKVENKLEDASREYRARYGSAGSSLTTFDALSRATGARAATLSHPYQITEQAIQDDLQLIWLGSPRDDAAKVELRVQHFVRQAEFLRCGTELDLTIDGQHTVHALAYDVSPRSVPLREALRADLDIDTVRSIAAASRVLLGVCGRELVLSSRAAEATRLFVKRFSNDSAAAGRRTVSGREVSLRAQ